MKTPHVLTAAQADRIEQMRAACRRAGKRWPVKSHERLVPRRLPADILVLVSLDHVAVACKHMKDRKPTREQYRAAQQAAQLLHDVFGVTA